MKLSKGNIVRIMMWFVMVFGGAALSIYFDLIYFKELFQNIIFHVVTLIFGLVLLQLVLRAAKNTGKFLAKNGREGNIPRLQTNKLVTNGLYACMRHPMHFGLMFFFPAIALLIGSPFFIIIVAPLEMLFMIIMIKLFEEKEAINKFGNEYIEYKNKVPFFSFNKKCLKEILKK